jgi:hypothetical protein
MPLRKQATVRIARYFPIGLATACTAVWIYYGRGGDNTMTKSKSNTNPQDVPNKYNAEFAEETVRKDSNGKIKTDADKKTTQTNSNS